MTANEIGDPSKEDAQTVALDIQHSPKNHEGKGVERAGETSSAK